MSGILSANGKITSANNKILKNEDFDLNYIKNLQMWLRADSGVSVSGNNVTSWVDKSLNAFVASPTSVPARPVFVPASFNGKPAIRFDGDDDLSLTTSLFTGTGDFSAFAVVSQSSVPTSAHVQGNYSFGPNNNGLQMWLTSAEEISIAIITNLSGTTTLALNNTWILYWQRSGGTVSLRVNGTQEATGTRAGSITGSSNWTIGNYASQTEPFFGDIYELAFFNRALTETERTQITNYLKQRYSIQ